VRAILVAHHRHHRHLVEQHRAPGVVGLGDLRVEALEYPLGDAGGLSHPGGGGQHQDVGSEQLLPDHRPLITATHVRGDPGFHVVVDHPHQGAFDTVPGEAGQDLLGEQLTAGGRR